MKVSATLKCQEIKNQRLANNLPVYDFGLGANPIPQPQKFIELVQKYAHLKDYTSAKGIPKFQKTIQTTFSNDQYKIQHVVCGNGLKEILFIAQLSFLQLYGSSSKIIHLTPSWVSYKEQIGLLGKIDQLVEIETTYEDGYKVDLKILDQTLQNYENCPKMLIFNNPNNPTGIHYTPQEVQAIAQVLKKHNCLVFTDEIYANLVDNIESISQYIPGQTIRGSSVSKDMGCGGYRLGWMTFPTELTDLFHICNSNASSVYSCPSILFQHATSDMFQNHKIFQNHCDTTKRIFSQIIQAVDDILESTNLDYIKPTGAWYMFIGFEKYKKQLEKKYGIQSSIQLSEYLINTLGIVTVPGEAFNKSGMNLRFSLVDIDVKKITFDKTNNKLNPEAYDKITKGFRLIIQFLDKLTK